MGTAWPTDSAISLRDDELHQPEALSRVVGDVVSSRDIEAEEDIRREIADGVVWRRRRLRFFLGDARHHERLCINELFVDLSRASVAPTAAMDSPHLCNNQEIEDTYWATAWAQGAVRGTWGMRDPRLFVDTQPLQGGAALDAVSAATLLHDESLRDSPQQHLRTLVPRLAPLPARFVEGNNPTGRGSIVRWLPAVPPSRVCLSREDVVAVTAAGFYLNFPEEYGDGYSSLHQPFGALSIEGRIVSPPWVERPALVIGEHSAPEFRLIGPESIRLAIGSHEVALVRGIADGSAHGSVWRAWDGPLPTPPEGTAALVFSGAALVHWGPAAKVDAPPIGGAVVWLQGEMPTAILEGQRPQVELSILGVAADAHIVSGGPVLVRGGHATIGDAILTPEFAGEFRPGGPPPSRFPFDVARTRAPRTAVGTSDGGLHLVVVDGRRPGEHSMGLTLEGLAHLCRLLGMHDAMNLDGGGSAVLALAGASRRDGISESAPLSVVNFPSDSNGKERILPSMLTVSARRRA